MDVRTDDFIAEVMVRSENSQEMKCVELFAHSFIVNELTGEIRFADEATRADLLAAIEADIFLAAKCELAAADGPSTVPG